MLIQETEFNDKFQETEFVGDNDTGDDDTHGGYRAMYKSESQEELCTIRMMEKQHMCKRIEQEKFHPPLFRCRSDCVMVTFGNNICENDSPSHPPELPGSFKPPRKVQ